MNNINYGKLCEDKIAEITVASVRPTLLLHSCCAPCSSYVLEYLTPHFDITLYFYNPNISSSAEYDYRLAELRRFAEEAGYRVPIIAPEYLPDEFYRIAHGKEDLPEGGGRCYSCYSLRLERTAVEAKQGGYDLFTTTLSISPHKNAAWLNELGSDFGKKYGVEWLYSDFKKKNGYKRSIELSREYSLYRQSFCGCEFSRRMAENGI